MEALTKPREEIIIRKIKTLKTFAKCGFKHPFSTYLIVRVEKPGYNEAGVFDENYLNITPIYEDKVGDPFYIEANLFIRSTKNACPTTNTERVITELCGEYVVTCNQTVRHQRIRKNESIQAITVPLTSEFDVSQTVPIEI